MRDHVTEELISAYVDGELEGDELKLVQGLLAESPEHQQLLAEFQALRASMWSLPAANLPADFPARVVSQIEDLAVSPSKEPVQRGTKAHPWRSVLFAAACLAAVLAATTLLSPPEHPPGIIETPFEVPVYLKKEPVHTMVIEVTVARSLQKERPVHKLLEGLGIGTDPALRLDSKLERELIAHRLPGGYGAPDVIVPLVDPDAPVMPDDDVEMIYVAGKLKVIDQLHAGLSRMANASEQVSNVHGELVFEIDKLGIMHRLHGSACDYFAGHQNATAPEDGQAFRLAFSFKLKRVSVAGSASFPVPTFTAEQVARDGSNVPPLAATNDEAIGAVEASRVSSELNEVNGTDAGDSDDADEVIPWGGDPGYVLLIIHYVDAQPAEATSDVGN